MRPCRSLPVQDATGGPGGRPSRRAVLAAAAASAVVAGPFSGAAAATPTVGKKRELLCVGTWQAGSVHGAWFDPDSGTISPLGPLAEVSAGWVTAHPLRPVLYVGGEEDGGYVRAFRVEPGTGAMRLISEVATDGGGTSGGGISHLSVDVPSGTLLVANFEAGLAASLPIGRDGALGSPLSVVRDTGSGPDPRQAGPHPHQVVVDPTGRYALVADFGADQVISYRFDRRTGVLSAGGAQPRTYHTPPGSGPRRLVFAPNGRTAYLLSELTAELQTLGWDPVRGELHHRQTLAVDSPGFPGTRSGAELALSRDGRFAYVSSRGENSLVVYALHARTGLPALVQRIPCGGTTPWSFSLHASGRWLLVANEASNNVVLFAVDPRTGRLTDTGESTAVPHPDGFAFFA